MTTTPRTRIRSRSATPTIPVPSALFVVGVIGLAIGGIDRHRAVPWEWLAFVALMFWLAVHTVVLGTRRSEDA